MQVSDTVILEKADSSAETTRKPGSAECVYEKVVHAIFPIEHSRLESQDRESPKQRGSGCSSEELNSRKCEGQGQKRMIQLCSDLLSMCGTRVLTLPSASQLSLVKTSPVTEPQLLLCGAQGLQN